MDSTVTNKEISPVSRSCKSLFIESRVPLQNTHPLVSREMAMEVESWQNRHALKTSIYRPTWATRVHDRIVEIYHPVRTYSICKLSCRIAVIDIRRDSRGMRKHWTEDSNLRWFFEKIKCFSNLEEHLKYTMIMQNVFSFPAQIHWNCGKRALSMERLCT